MPKIFNLSCFTAGVDAMKKRSVFSIFSFAFLLLFLSALSGSIALAQSGLDAHTIALFNFENVSGKKVKNEAGDAKLDGELKGDAKAVFGAGYAGAGLVLDGDGDYMRVNPFGNPAEGSLELWFKVTHAKPSPKSDAPGVLWNLSDIGNEYGEKFSSPSYLGTHTGLAAPNLWFGIWTGKWDVADSGIDAKTLVGVWHHVAGTWGKRGIEIWIDGKLKGTNKNYTGALPEPNYKAWHLGSGSWRADMEGTLDGVRLSKKQRIAEEFLLLLPVQAHGKLTTSWGYIKLKN